MKSKIVKFALIGQLLFVSCSKDADIVKQVPISSIILVNAVVNSNMIIADFTNSDSVAAYFSSTPPIPYGTSQEYSVPSGNVPLSIYPVADTSHPFFKGTIVLQGQFIYSLFLAGISNSQNKPDTVKTEDHPPYHCSTDSTAGLRFINLSPNSNPISVNIQGDVNTKEVRNLVYKAFTEFKLYPANSNVIQYAFEIRDASSDNLLITFIYPASPFQNATIVLDGLNGGPDNSLGVFIVNY